MVSWVSWFSLHGGMIVVNSSHWWNQCLSTPPLHCTHLAWPLCWQQTTYQVTAQPPALRWNRVGLLSGSLSCHLLWGSILAWPQCSLANRLNSLIACPTSYIFICHCHYCLMLWCFAISRLRNRQTPGTLGNGQTIKHSNALIADVDGFCNSWSVASILHIQQHQVADSCSKPLQLIPTEPAVGRPSEWYLRTKILLVERDPFVWKNASWLAESAVYIITIE